MSLVRFGDRAVPDELRQAAGRQAEAAVAALGRVLETVRVVKPGKVPTPNVYFDTVVLVAGERTSAGVRAVADALTPSHAALRKGAAGRGPLLLTVARPVSDSSLTGLLDLLDGRHPLLVLADGEGSVEAAVATRVLRSAFEKRYGAAEAARRTIAEAITEGPLSLLAGAGLTSLSLAGLDVASLLSGAEQFFAALRDTDPRAHAAVQYATLRAAAHASGKRLERLSLGEPRLASLGAWWSLLGTAATGLLPLATSSSAAGPHPLALDTFLFVEPTPALEGRHLSVPRADSASDGLGYLEGRSLDDVSAAALLASRLAHQDAGVPCLSLGVPRLDGSSLGALMAFFETSAALTAALLGAPSAPASAETYLGALLGQPGSESLGVSLRRRL